MKTVLELVREDQYYHLISVESSTYQYTPLHWLCGIRNSAAVLEVIMRLVTSEQTRYKLLQIPDSDRWTPLHYAAVYNATKAIRIIADSVSSHHLIHLLTITDRWSGYTPVQRAACQGKQEAEEILQYYLTTTLIDIRTEEALQQSDEKSE